MANDYHWSKRLNKMVEGLEPEYEELVKDRDNLDAQIQSRLTEMPMLKGKGFIVIAPSAPRYDGEEFEDVEEARAHGADVAHQHGVAIVYAPVAVLRPRRDVVDSTPSKLLEQLQRTKGIASGAKIASQQPDTTAE